MPGIRNIGNTCYLASAIQLLVGSQGVKFSDSEMGILLEEFRASDNVLDPDAIKLRLEAHCSQFCGLEQQDAHEALLVLMELAGVEKNFQLEWTNQATCECGQVVAGEGKDIQVILFQNSCYEDQLKRYLTRDAVCQCGRELRLVPEVTSFPEQLLLMLPKTEGKNMRGLDNEIDFFGEVYQFNAAVEHRGTHSSGHYTASVQDRDKTMLCNDSSLTERKMTFQSPSLYLLSYQKTDLAKMISSQVELNLQRVSAMPNLRQFPLLLHLSVSNCLLSSLGYLPSTLKTLSLPGLNLRSLPDLSSFPLDLLNISGNRIRVVSLPKSLRVLNVAWNKIKQLPDFSIFFNLKVLDLRGLELNANYVVPEFVEVVRM